MNRIMSRIIQIGLMWILEAKTGNNIGHIFAFLLLQGKLVFKNGRVYEGEFIYDRIAEYPHFKIDIMNTQDLSGIRTKAPVGTGKQLA